MKIKTENIETAEEINEVVLYERQRHYLQITYSYLKDQVSQVEETLEQIEEKLSNLTCQSSEQ